VIKAWGACTHSLSPWQIYCQRWCRKWHTESLTRRFSGCVIRRLFACSRAWSAREKSLEILHHSRELNWSQQGRQTHYLSYWATSLVLSLDKSKFYMFLYAKWVNFRSENHGKWNSVQKAWPGKWPMKLAIYHSKEDRGQVCSQKRPQKLGKSCSGAWNHDFYGLSLVIVRGAGLFCLRVERMENLYTGVVCSLVAQTWTMADDSGRWQQSVAGGRGRRQQQVTVGPHLPIQT